MNFQEMIEKIAERNPQTELPPVHWVEPRPRCGQCRDFEVMESGQICTHCQKEQDQGYIVMSLAGRCANGAERDHGTRFHAVETTSYKALCGSKPGRRSVGWSRELGPVSCPRCISKLARAE